MQTVVIVIHLIIVLGIIGLVLLQRSEGGGLGMGGGGGILSSRGTSNILTRSTAILAGLFFLTSLVLSVLAGVDRRPTSILNTGGGAPTGAAVPAGTPQAPLGQQGGGVLDQLNRMGNQPAQPGAPAPQGPQVPQSQ